MFGTPHRQASYQVLGDMTLLFGGHHEELASGYRRSLDLDDGIAAVEYELGGVRFRREVFASAPDDVVVLRFEASGTGAVELGIALLPPLRRIRADRGTRPRGRRRRRSARLRVLIPRTRRRGGRDRRAARRPHLRSGSGRGHDPRRRGDRLPPRRPRAGVPRHARRRRPRGPSTELRARHVESHRPPMRRVRLRLGGQPDRGSRGAPHGRAPRTRQGRGARPWPRRAALPVRALPAARLQPSRHLAGQPAGDLERQLPARVGQQVHDQHQPADELLAGRGREPGGVSRAALRPHRPASRHRRARRHACTTAAVASSPTTTPTSGPTPPPSTTSSAGCGPRARPGSFTTSGTATPTASTRRSSASAATRR